MARSIANNIANGIANGIANSIANDIAYAMAHAMAHAMAYAMANGIANGMANGNRELVAKMVHLGASLAVAKCSAYDTMPLKMAIILGASDIVGVILQVWPDIYGGGPLCAAVVTSAFNEGWSLVERILQKRPLSTSADILETTAVGLAAYL
ncbi:hypothetical protein ACMFMG_004090 [Clarireedia jacksonii]